MNMRRVTIGTLMLLVCLGTNLLEMDRPVAADGPDAKPAAKATKVRSRGQNKKQAEKQQREKVWNSPEMLHARAWLEEYFQASKKYTPEKAAEYRSHLKAMTAQQMELWLMQFEDKRHRQHQDQMAWHKVHHEMVASQVAAIRQRQRDLAKSESRASLAAAQGEQHRLQAQQNVAENMEANRRIGTGYGGYGGGAGYYVPSYHFHIYP